MAKTSVATRDGCTITVVHKIHFVKNPDMKAYDFNRYVRSIKKQLKEIWEDPEFRWKCCKVKFRFDYVAEAADDADDKELIPKFGRSHQGGQGPEKFKGDWFVGEPDPMGIGPYDCPAASHEVGHELGADDRYEDVYDNNGKVTGAKLKARDRERGYPEDGLMYQSSRLILEPSVQRIINKPHQFDIDEIMERLGADCPQSCCG